MQDTETAQAVEGLFVVRQGEGESAVYAICHRVATVKGDHRLSGTSKTAAELVDEQKLLAAFVSAGEYEGLRSLSFEPQSGQNVTVFYEEK